MCPCFYVEVDDELFFIFVETKAKLNKAVAEEAFVKEKILT